MKIRIVSGIIGGLLLFLILITGGLILDIAVLIVSLIAIHEFSNALEKINNLKPLSIMNYLLAISLFVINLMNNFELVQPILFLYSITLFIILVLNVDFSPLDISVTLFEGVYIVFFLFHVSLLNGSNLIWLIFVFSIATDTFAYFIGIKFGKRKLSPQLSPKKTIEGSIGGIAGSLLATMVFVWIQDTGHILELGLLSVICSVMSQIGDLTASRMKRLAGIKDYGNIMPGHGGVLDRFDSVLFTAPIVYYYMYFFV